MPSQTARADKVSRQLSEREHRPSVTIVFLVFNRRDELRESLRRMQAIDYESELLEFIVVDNASTDCSAAMVEAEFPDVRLIVRGENSGVSGFNDGFAAARGEFVLALDDDCYLPPDALGRAIAAAHEHRADLVSFGVGSSLDPDVRFDLVYRTGLLSFWGCAVLIRREVLGALHGYDPNIFVWANELEFMVRFFDHGFRHLHLPEVVAVHMKAPEPDYLSYISSSAYLFNARHFAYIAAKLLRARDAWEALFALLATHTRDAIREDPKALRAVPHALAGFGQGLSSRSPVSKRELSRVYRQHFESFASPWWLSRPLLEFVRPRGDTTRRRAEYFANRYHPESAATLEF